MVAGNGAGHGMIGFQSTKLQKNTTLDKTHHGIEKQAIRGRFQN
jgi:hypothetical protein